MILVFEENLINEVRYVDFEHFKNRYKENDGRYCIEALVTRSDIRRQIRRERRRRRQGVYDGSGSDEDDDEDVRTNEEPDDEKTLHRVRIQSPSVLFFLHLALKPEVYMPWKRQNCLTFYRPFTVFVAAQQLLKAKLQELEDRHANDSPSDIQKHTCTVAELVSALSRASGDEAEEHINHGHSRQHTSTEATISGSFLTSKDASPVRGTAERPVLERALLESFQSLLALRCFVKFVDERVMPQTKLFKSVDTAPHEITYQDLYYLYELGDLVVVNDVESATQISRPPQLARIYSKELRPLPSLSTARDPVNGRRKYVANNSCHEITIHYYTIDFIGHMYAPQSGTPCTIRPFGKTSIRSLQVLPLKYYHDKQAVISKLKDNGSRFVEAVSLKHMVYRGWSCSAPVSHVTRDTYTYPHGYQYRGGRRPLAFEVDIIGPRSVENAQKVDYIESNVIVDVDEAIRVHAHWAISAIGLGIYWRSWRQRGDDIPIIQWKDHHRRDKVSSTMDITVVSNEVPSSESEKYLKTDQFARPLKDPKFTDEDLLLLPGSIYAYALRDRKFFVGHVPLFRKYTTGGNPFDSLKIDPTHIRTVQSVVWSHFEQKKMESLASFSVHMDQDLIRGKGRGLVILLHGVPGVGKTATAEAVALWHQKPLFAITCGDLGFYPRNNRVLAWRDIPTRAPVELTKQMFFCLNGKRTPYRETRWSRSFYVLMRSRENSVLEYYNGILFLTTNRVGTLDEAFKSRVHLSLYYPALNQTQTEDIMRMNLRRLAVIEQQRAQSSARQEMKIFEDSICRFAIEHFINHAANDGEGRWNGRQIRNAVQVAASLALYEKEHDKMPGKDDLPPMLDAKHFETVQKTMIHFEGYMNKTRGGSSTFIAKQRSERDDGFRGTEQRYNSYPGPNTGMGGYSPYQPRPRTPQMFGMPQPNPSQLYPNPSGSMYDHPGPPSTASSSYLAADPAHGYGQADSYRPAMHHPAAPNAMGMNQYGSSQSYTTVPPPAGVMPTISQAGPTNLGSQGYQPAR
ncbi:hypothetical protein F5Y18DRAFT_429131 [Xylariaceae sp. FL1019]|nr:hypothetical protein F5Y18DRAFT_429131 [Xylariaceae sp. FL1019]